MFLFAVYLAFVLQWTFVSNLGAASTAGGVLLWLFIERAFRLAVRWYPRARHGYPRIPVHA